MTRRVAWLLAGCVVVAAGSAAPAVNRALGDAEPPSGFITDWCSTDVDVEALRASDPDALRVDRQIDSIFRAALAAVDAAMQSSVADQINTLGKLVLFDRNLSVNRNQACTSCHMPDAGFTGSIEAVNRTLVAYPGSVPGRVGARRPQTYAYAPLAPIVHYDSATGELIGGNFWDMRATGLQLNNPAAEQALGPPLNPLEMGMSDAACVVRRLAESDYRNLFERIWGDQSFAVRWPDDVDEVCARPGPAPANDTLPVHLSPTDRLIVQRAYENMARAMATYEASPEVSPFSSKFDYALAHPDQQVLSDDELAGWELFRGKAGCNSCHTDGTSRADGRTTGTTGAITPELAADIAPLFTDFSAANLGVPRNPELRFYCLDKPDEHGYVTNPDGREFRDLAVGGFLRTSTALVPRDWAAMADQLDGQVRVPTLRNVDKRPRPDFVKAYMHNGYFKSLRDVVHFYNTRDLLPTCEQGEPGEAVTCWPPAEVALNVDSTIGNLGLTEREVDQIVAFLRTLTDGWVSGSP